MAIVTEEGLSKIISIVGTHATDITYYLARTLNAAGTKCLVVDNSRDKYLFRSIPKAQGETMAQTGEIVYVQGVAYSEVFFAQYDFVLIHHGLSMNEELLKRSDYIYIVTDYLQYSTEKIKELLSDELMEKSYYLVCRDKVTEKTSVKQLVEEMGLTEARIEESYELYYNEQDYLGFFNLLRSGHVQIKGLSGDMKEFLKGFLLTAIEKEKNKEYKKILQQLMTGKIR